MKLKEFINEFRIICTDSWGDAVEAWFECAGHLYNRNTNIPSEWMYSPGAGDGMDEDSYWHELFKNATTEELETIGAFLTKYCHLLESKGMSY
jgi:hypothetical protein